MTSITEQLPVIGAPRDAQEGPGLRGSQLLALLFRRDGGESWHGTCIVRGIGRRGGLTYRSQEGTDAERSVTASSLGTSALQPLSATLLRR